MDGAVGVVDDGGGEGALVDHLDGVLPPAGVGFDVVGCERDVVAGRVFGCVLPGDAAVGGVVDDDDFVVGGVLLVGGEAAFEGGFASLDCRYDDGDQFQRPRLRRHRMFARAICAFDKPQTSQPSTNDQVVCPRSQHRQKRLQKAASLR